MLVLNVLLHGMQVAYISISLPTLLSVLGWLVVLEGFRGKSSSKQVEAVLRDIKFRILPLNSGKDIDFLTWRSWYLHRISAVLPFVFGT